MTASAADVSLVKPSSTPADEANQMEKVENGSALSRLPKPLAIEVYTKIHNSNLSKDDLLDEIEDLVDEKYFVGETLVNQGKEYVVVSSEKRGGLTLYTMEGGEKIGHRDLRRKKGLSVEEIKQIAMEDVVHDEEDGKWKVKEELLKENPIKEKKFAPIFSSANRKAQSAAASSSKVVQLESDGDSEGEDGDGEKKKNGENGISTPSRRASAPRASGGPAASASRRQMDKKKEKEAKDREKMELKKKEAEEKQRKKDEEKAKKQAEKDEKMAKKAERAIKKAASGGDSGSHGLMDRFVKKEENGDSSGGAAGASKWGEKRIALGLKKMDDGWKRRDLEAFNEACLWCEKNLSANQRATFENPIWKFAVQKLVDKTKDKALIKGWKRAKQVEYRHEMIEKRKPVYSMYEPKIKAWFSEDIMLDDLLVTTTPLSLPTESKRLDCDEELLKCMEISQYFVSMRKILLWNENISAEQLRDDLHKGLEGFKRSTYKMIANLLETALQEKEHEKVAHLNARLSEFPITEHTITEMVRAFFIGSKETSFKRDQKPRNMIGKVVEEDSANSEDSDGEKDGEDVQEGPSTSSAIPKAQKEEAEPEEISEDREGQADEEEPEDTEIDDEEEARKQKMTALFQNPTHLYDWAPCDQLEVLFELKELIHELPIIREWYLRDANSEQLTGLKGEAAKIAKKIETAQQQLADLPSGEITDDMSRHQTREMEKVIKKRQTLEKQLDDLKDELEENREKAARERDDLERIYRVVSIGNDRHLRKYYWFAYSTDAGIWVQDFGTTSYEKWVSECREKGFMDVETSEVENRPEYEDLPIFTIESPQIWYKLDSEPAVRDLLQSLAKNGKREKPLRKYIQNNLDDILGSIRCQQPSEKKANKKNGKDSGEDEDVTEEAEDEEEEEQEMEIEDQSKIPEEPTMVSRFTGPFGSLKQVMSEFLSDYKGSGITKIGDIQAFDAALESANSLDEMKRLLIELVTSIPKECLIEKYKMDVALIKKCFSHLLIPRFCRRIEEATNPSCLHMLIAYFDARIDQKRTLPELPCQVCHRKTATDRKLMCKQCGQVYHYNCHRPTIGYKLFEEPGFKEGWWCAKCTKEDRRRQLIEAKEQREANGNEDQDGGSGSDRSDDEEDPIIEMEEDEEDMMSRGRSAKRKANTAMRDVLEFEGRLRGGPAPPPPSKKVKKEVKPEVQSLFDSIEKANPRLYKVIQSIPSQSRSTRNSTHETRSLLEIEDDLDVYETPDDLHQHLTAFFHQARGYIETHNPRKLDELDDLITELNFV